MSVIEIVSLIFTVDCAKYFDTEEMEYIFRLSFSHPEKMLCNSMNETQLNCYRLMKAIHQEKLKKCSERFTSYHIKTLLFWAIEKNEIDT